MKILKNVFSFCLSILLAVCCSREGKALFGNAHYSIGEKIIEKMEKPLTEMERAAFLSGMVYADVGRLKFDELCRVQSDSREFLKILYDNAETDQEKWFAKGVEMHILQDEMAAEILIDSFGKERSGYADYVMQCGTVDYYFFKKSGRYIYSDVLSSFDFNELSSLPEYKTLCKSLKISEEQVKPTSFEKYLTDKKSLLVSCDDLLIKTYSTLGLNITRDELHQQQANMLGAFFITSFVVGDKQELTPSLMSAVESESEKIAAACAEHIK